MFSTDEGVNDFISWLEKDSGYSAKEKKTILQKLADWVLEIIDAIEELMQGKSLNDVVAELAKEETARFKEIRGMFLEALEGVAEGTVGRETKNTAEGGVKMSIKEKKIFRGMSDVERANIIKEKHLKNLPFVRKLSSEEISSWEEIDVLSGNAKQTLIHNLAKEFGVFKEYSNEDISLTFEFTHNGYRETYGKQKKNFKAFAKMFSVFDKVIENAVGIEVHNRNEEGYKPDVTLENVYVLLSAYEDENSITLIKLAVKEFKDKSNKLYVAIALETIKKTEVSKQGNTNNGVTQNSRSVNISILDLISKINPKDTDFLKYIPNELLNEEQIKSKEIAEADVKYSLDWIDFAEEKAIERSLVSEITELKKINEELRGKIQHPGVKHIVNQAAVQKVARSLKSGYMSKINVHVLSEELGTLYGYLANENGLNWDNVKIHLESIATKILDESKYKNPDISEYAKEIIKRLSIFTGSLCDFY